MVTENKPGNSFFQNTVFLYFTTVVAAIDSSIDTVFFRRALAAMNCVYRICLTDISIQGLLLFQKSTWSHYIWVAPSLFQEVTGSVLAFLKSLWWFFETSTCSHLLFQRYWVNSQSQLQSCIQNEWSFFYIERVIVATYSLRFTMFLQNRNCNKKIT